MTGDTWLDRFELFIAHRFPARGRHLRARVDTRRLVRVDRVRRRLGEAIERGWQ